MGVNLESIFAIPKGNGRVNETKMKALREGVHVLISLSRVMYMQLPESSRLFVTMYLCIFNLREALEGCTKIINMFFLGGVTMNEEPHTNT